LLGFDGQRTVVVWDLFHNPRRSLSPVRVKSRHGGVSAARPLFHKNRHSSARTERPFRASCGHCAP
jgi:hypothetical protein